MLRYAFVALAVTAGAPALAQDSPPAAVASPATLTSADMAKDPRMIAAVRHANATADRKCGDVGGIVGLEAKAAGRTCRKHMVDAAKMDAAYDINGGH